MKNKEYCQIASIAVMLMLSAVALVKAPIPGPGTLVAIVPDPSSTNGGTLASTNAAFANFTFTNLPWVNVTAGNLTTYQIVVLVIDAGAPTPLLSLDQATDLNNWVSAGGKLIIYDSEMPAIDYSWLVYPFTTSNPGAAGASGQPITYNEDNTLGDNDPTSPYFINTTQSDVNIWSDAIGDGNVFATQDSHWCGDIEAENYLGDIGWIHTYAVYGDGMMIYNGFDIDAMGPDDVPGTVGIANLVKVWLLELQQPWGSDYNLPCARRVTVGGEIIEGPALSNLIIIAAAAAMAIAAFALLSKKLLHMRSAKLPA